MISRPCIPALSALPYKKCVDVASVDRMRFLWQHSVDTMSISFSVFMSAVY